MTIRHLYFGDGERDSLRELCEGMDRRTVRQLARKNCPKGYFTDKVSGPEQFETAMEFMYEFLQKRESSPEMKILTVDDDEGPLYFVGTYEELNQFLSEPTTEKEKSAEADFFFDDKSREILHGLCEEIDFAILWDIADAKCESESANEFSSGIEVFKNAMGFMIEFLRKREQDPERRIFEYEDMGRSLFFVGTFSELAKKFSEEEEGNEDSPPVGNDRVGDDVFFSEEEEMKLREMCGDIDSSLLNNIAKTSHRMSFDKQNLIGSEIFKKDPEFRNEFFQMRKKVPGRKVLEFMDWGVNFFFVGTYEELVKKFSDSNTEKEETDDE